MHLLLCIKLCNKALYEVVLDKTITELPIILQNGKEAVKSLAYIMTGNFVFVYQKETMRFTLNSLLHVLLHVTIMLQLRRVNHLYQSSWQVTSMRISSNSSGLNVLHQVHCCIKCFSTDCLWNKG